MRFGKCLMAVVAVMSASSALAQGQGQGGGRFGGMGGGFGGGFGGGGGDPSFLLMAPSVQTELTLSDDQKTSLQKLQQDMMASGRDFFQQMQGLSQEERQKKVQERAKENRKKIAEILLPQQMDRLDEISLQQSGAGALSRDDVADKLALTDDQKGKLKDLADDTRQKIMDTFSGGPPQDDQERQEMQKKVTEIRTQQSDKALAILTDEQKSKFEKMQGKKFDLASIQFPGFGGGRRPGGGGGTPGGGQGGNKN
jgi:hypothetical protein